MPLLLQGLLALTPGWSHEAAGNRRPREMAIARAHQGAGTEFGL